ncbi:MAG: Gfo/Idh/MocA family protein, partial [Pirellula sp.]
MAKKKPLGRRRFLGLSICSSLAISTTFSVPNIVRARNASDKLRICVIGIRGRGMGLATGFASRPNALVTHICDVNQSLFKTAAQKIKDVQQVEPMAVQDLRRVMDDKSIDAIVVATPDHWHALATIWGCQAGKHVYVEKPISQNVFEGWQEVQASRKYDRRVQVGTQCRS